MSTNTYNTKTITRDEVTHLCNLVRIGASDEEKDELVRDLSRILGYVEQISSIEVPSDADARHVYKNRMRDDDFTYTTKVFTNILLDALPRSEGDYALVHKVLNKDTENK